MSIEIEIPLSDRTLKYGRNSLVLSGIIIVLGFLPKLDISKAKPFGLEFSADDEPFVWALFALVLIYYMFQFGLGVVADKKYLLAQSTPPLDAIKSEANKDRLHQIYSKRNAYLQRDVFDTLSEFVLRFYSVEFGNFDSHIKVILARHYFLDISLPLAIGFIGFVVCFVNLNLSCWVSKGW